MDETKSSLLSMGIWGGAIAFVAQALAMFGITLDVPMLQATANDILSIAGAVLAIIGRFRAKTKLTLV